MLWQSFLRLHEITGCHGDALNVANHEQVAFAAWPVHVDAVMIRKVLFEV